MPISHKKRWDEGADWRWLLRAGQGLRPSKEGTYARENTLAIMALRARGHTLKAIAQRMGTDTCAVRDTTKQYGVFVPLTQRKEKVLEWGWWCSCEIDLHGRLEQMHDAQWARLPIKKKDIVAMRAQWIARHAAIKHTPEYKIRKFVRRQTYRLVRGARGEILKNSDMIEYLGCSNEHAIKHIESLLHDGWTWANHGKVWHIDHIVQLSDGSPYDEAHRRRVCHYTNLRPLAAVENLARPKGRYVWCKTGMKAS